MTEEKRECKRLGYEYKVILSHILAFLEGYTPAKDFINDFTREKLQELCLGLETGEFEIIEFGNIIEDKKQ